MNQKTNLVSKILITRFSIIYAASRVEMAEILLFTGVTDGKTDVFDTNYT